MCYTNQTKCQVHILLISCRASVRLFVLGWDVFTDHFQAKSELSKVRFYMPRVTNDTRFCEKVAILDGITMPSSNQ